MSRSIILVAALWVVGVVIPCNGGFCESPPAESASSSGTLTFFLENDIFVGRDDEYTSGVGISWTSGNAAKLRQSSFVPRVVRAMSFLPKIGDPEFRSFASLTFGQEMYTPRDIELPIPPPDEQPYAGVIFLDSSVFGHGEKSMHEYTLRLGCVGPCSGAAESQRTLHKWLGAPMPQGWDYQLQNEPLLNFSYQYRRRLVRRVEAVGLGYDVTFDGGGSLGNYMTGADTGVIGRIGFALPDTYGNASLRTGGASRFVGLDDPPREGWQVWIHLGLQLFGVVRFLPTDGNTFKDSPSGPRDDFIGYASTGLVVGYRRFLFSWSLNNLAGLNEIPRSNSTDFGTLTLSYTFAMKSSP